MAPHLSTSDIIAVLIKATANEVATDAHRSKILVAELARNYAHLLYTCTLEIAAELRDRDAPH
jgi:hypothetical protein